MSSYLSFYALPKVEDNKPLCLICYSRNSKIYQYFNNNLHVAYIEDSEGNTQYTELTVAKVNEVLEDLKNDIDKTNKRIAEYEKHANGDEKIIEYIIEQKEYIEDLEWASHKIEFIQDLIYEASYNHTDYSKILCNID